MMERKRFTKAVKKVTAVALAAAMFFGMMPIKSVFAANDTLEVTTAPTVTTYGYNGNVSSTAPDLTGGRVTYTSSDANKSQINTAIGGAITGYTYAGPSTIKLNEAGEQTVTITYTNTANPTTVAPLVAKYKVNVVHFNKSVVCYGNGFSELDAATGGGTITVMKGTALDLSQCYARYTSTDASNTTTDIAITTDKLNGTYDLTKPGTYSLNVKCDVQTVDNNGALKTVTKSLPIKLIVTDFMYKVGITYRAHVQNVGWQEWKDEGGMAGTTGKSLRMEALKINAVVMKPNAAGTLVATNDIESPILYQSHIQNAGWENSWTKSNTNFYTGTVGSSLRMEAVKIQLNETLAKGYDIYYRVHIQNKGWTGWLKNGEEAGTTGKSLRLEAIEIRLDEKA